MNYRDKYYKWLMDDYIDEETKEELLKIKDDEREIEDRFYKDIEFGTAGLRGIMGAGTNRINKYSIRRATQGLANYLMKEVKKPKERGVVIAYDSRHKSSEFALEAALVLAGNGFKVYLFESLRTTPELSFAIRELNCSAGIVITASHNPPEYNGYKVYDEEGGQMVPIDAYKIIEEINLIEDFSMVKMISREKAIEAGLLKIIGKEIDDKYIEMVKSLSLRPWIAKEAGDFKIVYTPLHGAGAMPVTRVLREMGFNLEVVKEQEVADGDFPTVKYPNPEEYQAFEKAIELAKKVDADIIIGTDPDCDRVGVAVKDKEDYIILTGNQTGVLLIDYILSSMERIPKDGAIIKTIVTSELGRAIAESYGVEMIDTLTGFKYIGEKIKEFERDGSKKFIFGYEESNGYLAGTFVRDKDGVISSLLICEMAAFYKSKGFSLLEALEDIYNKYGFYKEDVISITLKGREGLERINRIMNALREKPPIEIEGLEVKIIKDYLNSRGYDRIKNIQWKLDLPSSEVLHFTLADGSWFAVRPSGTEPKLKIYFSAVATTEENAEGKLQRIKGNVIHMIEDIK